MIKISLNTRELIDILSKNLSAKGDNNIPVNQQLFRFLDEDEVIDFHITITLAEDRIPLFVQLQRRLANAGFTLDGSYNRLDATEVVDSNDVANDYNSVLVEGMIRANELTKEERLELAESLSLYNDWAQPSDKQVKEDIELFEAYITLNEPTEVDGNDFDKALEVNITEHLV